MRRETAVNACCALGVAWGIGTKAASARVFPPTTLEAYECDIYQEPAPEIR
jgi:hypothetical protein